MKFFRKIFILCLCLAGCLCAVGFTGGPDDTNTGQVDISSISDDNLALPNQHCRLYYIADLAGKFDPRFESYHFNLDVDNLRDATALANALRGVIARDNIVSDFSDYTNTSGKVSFVGLKPGVWLLTSSSVTLHGVTYHSQPSLFVIYAGDDLKLEIKHTVERPPERPDEPEKETTIQKVLKKWDDCKYEGRPKSIRVELLRNGRVYDTVELSARNNWRYTWTDLDKYADWSIVEIDVEDGYVCDLSQSGITTVLTNIREPDKPDKPSEPPDIPDKPDKPDVPDRPDVPDKPDIPDKPEKPPKIPQTGTTWYLVPMFSGIGVFLLFIGLWVRGKGREKK